MLNNNGKSNDKFVFAYKIDKEFGLFLDGNIYLFHLLNENLLSDILPWYYADAQKYLGDTWWESDNEILESIQNLPVVEFLKRYKGFLG